mmetsp:Transcript_23144/g.28403  ORF Transcript_23144/g.28403 Transcript_23144/m.28403 type:complete len:300 (-) Transcript_23144:2441-3340(-)
MCTATCGNKTHPTSKSSFTTTGTASTSFTPSTLDSSTPSSTNPTEPTRPISAAWSPCTVTAGITSTWTFRRSARSIQSHTLILSPRGRAPGPGFFQAILAVSSMHPILNYTFDSMVNEWYYNPKVEDVVEDKTDSKFISTRIYKTVKGWFYDSGVKVKPLGKAITQMKFIPARIYTEDNLRKLTDTVEAAFMGPGTLKRGYERHYNNTQTSWLLKEIFNRDPVKYEALSRIKKNWLCDYLVHDEETSTPYFYSRILGIRSCPEKDAEIKDEVEKDTETKDEAEKDIETKDEVEKKEVKK